MADRPGLAEWQEWVERYHPLGYRKPLGCYVAYFLRDRRERLLGCLLFDPAARRLPCRDEWIGWQDGRGSPPVTRRAPPRSGRAR